MILLKKYIENQEGIDCHWSGLIHVVAIIFIYNRAIGLMSSVFANGPGDRGLIPGRVIPKTQKMVLDADLLSTQHYKVRIKDKVEQSLEWCSSD